MNIENELRKNAKTINKKIMLDLENPILPLEFQKALKYFFNAGGKRIRPSISIFSCKSVGGKVEDVLPLATSIELIHTATIIYDDIIDRDKLRRGHQSLHERYGEDLAIVTGAILVARAIEEINIDSRIFPLFSKALYNTGIGEAMDIRLNIEDMDTYLHMVKLKCAPLIQISALGGGIIGGGKGKKITALSHYGENLGIAFQLRDDILDFIGDEKKLGKPIGSDIREKRASVATILLSNYLDKTPQKLISIYKEEGIPELIDIAISSGCIKEAEDMCNKFGNNAKSALESFPDSESKTALIELANFIVNRGY